jgi:hypothetical protein
MNPPSLFPHSILQNNIIMLNPHKYIYTFKTICWKWLCSWRHLISIYFFNLSFNNPIYLLQHIKLCFNYTIFDVKFQKFVQINNSHPMFTYLIVLNSNELLIQQWKALQIRHIYNFNSSFLDTNWTYFYLFY